MKILIDIARKINFDLRANRIGPDLPFTHWQLYFASRMKSICMKKLGRFGQNSAIRPHSYLVHCSNIFIGNNVIVRPGSHFYADEFAEIIIHDDVLIGANVHIYVNNHKFDNKDIPISKQGYYPSESVVIEAGCWIGANVTILPGVTIGQNAVIAAGTIVTKSVKAGDLVMGASGRVFERKKNV